MNGTEARNEAPRIEAAVDAVVEVARHAGLAVTEPRVLRHVSSVVVHLRPQPLVGRALPTDDLDSAASRDLDRLERQVRVPQWLAERGASVVSPATWVEPGPVERNGYLVTLWEYVGHDPTATPDGRRAGRRLREIHDLLAQSEIHGLPHFMRAEELTGLLERLRLAASDARLFERALTTMGTALEGFAHLNLQPVHGDAHLGNVLMGPRGPVWTDFDKLCLGPRELDVACNEIRSRALGRTAEDDAFLLGYGEHDTELVQVLVNVQTLVVAAWTFALAERRPEFAELAAQRLQSAADGLGV